MSQNITGEGVLVGRDGEVVTVLTPPVYCKPFDERAGKNIVVCADGTGNANIKGRASNVFKLFEAIDTTSHSDHLERPRQIAFYHEGVGTESWWGARVFGAATGLEYSRHVRHLYDCLSRVYAPGDRIYLFGFSRGAFTVRTLAGLIDACGIINAGKYETNAALVNAVDQSYKNYIARASHSSSGTLPTVATYERSTSRVEFLGVWDTVDAVGLPFPIADWLNRHVRRFKQDVHRLHSCVRYGCQALAIDEQREAFTPVLWEAADNVEQVWFAGAHSDIGGGYPRQGLSLIPLYWMMERARARGLRFVESDARYYNEHQIIADKLHDPRSGIGLYYRWKPRNVAALCEAAGVEAHLHLSVFELLAQGVDGYAPSNIPTGCVLSFTERRDWQYLNPAHLTRVVAELSGVFKVAAQKTAPALSVGIRSYWLFVLASILMIAGAAVFAVALTHHADSRIGYVLGAAGLLTVVMAYGLAKATDDTFDVTYSRLWQRVRPRLRQGLARSAMPADETAVITAAGTKAVSSSKISSP